MTRTLGEFLVLVALLLIGCGGSPAPPSPPTIVAVQTTKVIRQTITQTVSAGGDLFPQDQADISPKISAPVRKFYVKRGDPVRQGQLLATLENGDLAAAASAAEGAYDKAQADYATIKTTTVPEQLQTAELNLRNAQANLDTQQKLYESSVWLYEQKALARKQVDQANVALTNAKTQYLTAEKHLKDYRDSGATQQVRAAEGQMESARGQLLSSKAQLQYTEIHSPIKGVVANLAVFPGAIAGAGTPLITVMNVSSVSARLHVPQPQAALLRLGDAATIHVPGLDTGIPAKVTVFSPALDPKSTTVEIWVTAPNPQQRLQPGTSVEVSITAKIVPNALVAPDSSILTDANGAKSVMVVSSDGRVYHRAVVTGIKDAGKTQIVSGLNEGEEIVATGAYGLPDKTKVKASPAGSSTTGSNGG